jgi:hypothetical protein
MTSDRTLSLSTVTHIINAPLEKVNIADWLFNLSYAEYQRCSLAHIAAGTTTSDDGRPMKINVETIGDALMVQHFVAEVWESHLCRMVSISDAITAKGRTKVQLVWQLSAKKIDEYTCEYSNYIHASATDDSWHSSRRMALPLNKPGLLGRRHQTLITAKKPRTLPKASNLDPY